MVAHKPVGGTGGSSIVLEAGTGRFSCPFEISLHTNLCTVGEFNSPLIHREQAKRQFILYLRSKSSCNRNAVGD